VRESGCNDVEGMCVMKYSWKQRCWRADGAWAIDEGDAKGYRKACVHAMHAIGGLRLARGRCNEGFHMLSLAAKEAWCCSAGNYVVVGLMGITISKPSCRKSCS
jgi:hypothetical protein